MVRKKRKQNISTAERARRRRQALINFGRSKKTKRRGSTLAKRRKVSKRRRYGVKSDDKLKVIVPAGFGYGLVREYASDKLAPLTNKIPLGNISDEIGMLGVLYGARKWLFKKKGMLRDVTKGGMYVEAARIGQATKDGQLGGLFNFGNKTISSGSSVPVV